MIFYMVKIIEVKSCKLYRESFHQKTLSQLSSETMR